MDFKVIWPVLLHNVAIGGPHANKQRWRLVDWLLVKTAMRHVVARGPAVDKNVVSTMEFSGIENKALTQGGRLAKVAALVGDLN